MPKTYRSSKSVVQNSSSRPPNGWLPPRRKAQIDALSDGVTITHKAGDEGRLFGSVGTRSISPCLRRGRCRGEQVRGPAAGRPFRVAGEYEVAPPAHTDVDAQLKVTIVGEA